MRNLRPTTACIGLLLMVALAFSGGAIAQKNNADKDDNRGVIKIHDDLATDPDEKNEPHVTCDFYVLGFNMKDPTGYLVFTAWPPTANKTVVTPAGDTRLWVGTPDGDGEYNFTKGPYVLPAGHYRVEAYTYDGHPGHVDGHFAKDKMFWVDPCEEVPPCVDDVTTVVDECAPGSPCVDDDTTVVDECAPGSPCVDDNTTVVDECAPGSPCVDDNTTVVDECAPESPCVDDNTTVVDECAPESPCVDDPATDVNECEETEIPFFPGFMQLALGSLGALAMVGLALRRRS